MCGAMLVGASLKTWDDIRVFGLTLVPFVVYSFQMNEFFIIHPFFSDVNFILFQFVKHMHFLLAFLVPQYNEHDNNTSNSISLAMSQFVACQLTLLQSCLNLNHNHDIGGSRRII